MLRRTHIRRPLAFSAMLAGAVMIFLGSETWAGILVFALGVLIEAVGIAISRKE